MKLDVGPRSINPVRPSMPEVGDVYVKAGHRAGYWWVVAANPQCVHLLAFDLDGNITGANRYATYYFEKNACRRVGRAPFPDRIAVEWDTPPHVWNGDRPPSRPSPSRPGCRA